VVDRLADKLSEIGVVSIDRSLSSVDFNMSKLSPFTRSVFLVCFQPRVYGVRLIRSIREVLSGLKEDYLIVVDGQFSHGDSFYIFLSKGKAEGWFKDVEKARVFEPSGDAAGGTVWNAVRI
jgi:hypothetical protein